MVNEIVVVAPEPGPVEVARAAAEVAELSAQAAECEARAAVTVAAAEKTVADIEAAPTALESAIEEGEEEAWLEKKLQEQREYLAMTLDSMRQELRESRAELMAAVQTLTLTLAAPIPASSLSPAPAPTEAAIVPVDLPAEPESGDGGAPEAAPNRPKRRRKI